MLNLLPKSVSAPSRHSKLSQIMSYGGDLIQIDDGLRSKSDLSSLPSPTKAIRSLIDNGILKEAANKSIPQRSYFYDRDYLTLLVCNITVNSIMVPHKLWQFSFDLWIKNKSKWYSHTFKMSREHFKQLSAMICFNESNSEKGQSILFFAQHSYPKTPKSTTIARSDELMKLINKENEYLRRPQLPKTGLLFKKTANMDFANKYALYLQHCFSSLSLLIQDWFYTLLGDNGLNDDLASYIKSSAHKRLNTLKYKTLEKNCSIKRLSRRNEFKFHTCYITSRPLHDPSSDLLNFNHWALKFEGDLSLLTIEFFAAQKGVKIRQLMNSTMSRRIFWYWWDPDRLDRNYMNNNINNHQSHNLLYFTRRWKVIERFTFDKNKHITAPLLSHIVEKWLLTGQNKKYHVFKNNCQHFVRDIVAVLDRNIALSLNSFLDHTTLTNLIPVVAIGDGLAEHARTLEISKHLGDALKEYKIIQKNKKRLKKQNRYNLNNNVQRMNKNYNITFSGSASSGDVKLSFDANNNDTIDTTDNNEYVIVINDNKDNNQIDKTPKKSDSINSSSNTMDDDDSNE